MKYQRILYSLLQRAAGDEEFLSAWKCVADAEEQLLPLRESLSDEQDSLLDEYIYSLELLGLTFSRIAYEMGREQVKHNDAEQTSI